MTMKIEPVRINSSITRRARLFIRPCRIFPRLHFAGLNRDTRMNFRYDGGATDEREFSMTQFAHLLRNQVEIWILH